MKGTSGHWKKTRHELKGGEIAKSKVCILCSIKLKQIGEDKKNRRADKCHQPAKIELELLKKGKWYRYKYREIK